MKYKKTAILLLVIYICTIISPVFGEGFLPSLDKALGISMPLVSKIILTEPSQSNKTEDGSTVEEYTDVSYDDYNAIGRCFKKSGFSLVEQSYSNNIIQMILRKENHTVSISYDVTGHIFKVNIPKYFTEDDQCYDPANEQSVFPDIEEIAGTILPRLSAALKREPDVIRDDNGRYIEEYFRFDEDAYKLISEYLLQEGCEVKDYSKEGNILTINLAKKEDAFKLLYDPDSHKATMEYAKEAFLEPMVTNTPAPTPTPKPTKEPIPTPTQGVSAIEPEHYEEFAAIYIMLIKSMTPYSESVVVHGLNVMKYKGEKYLVVAFSGINEYGRNVQDIYSFRFEKASILSSEEDYAAMDLYKNHRSEFSLVKSLSVDAVMRIVNN